MNKIGLRLKDENKNISIFFYVLIFMFVRYLCYGFTYFHQLDDYIQYWFYPRFDDIWNDVVMVQGLLCSRPLAGLFDVYVWGNFFYNMIFAVFIISVLYSLSAVLFLDVFKKYFKTGFMFTVFYSLMPFFYEGAYWVSASSRVILGLFFTAMSCWVLQKFLETSKKRYIPVFWIIQLISLCYYEQTFILSMVLNFIITVLNVKEGKNRKNLLLLLILAANAIIYYGITKYFSSASSAMGSRMQIRYPELNHWYFDFIKEVLTQMKTAFIDVPKAITFTGFMRGLKLIVSDKLWIFIPVTAVLSVAAFYLCKSEKSYNEANSKKGLLMLCGALLAIMPVSLFFVIDNPYISMRNVLPSFVGIALISDMVFSYLAYRKKVIMSVVAAGLSALFFIASVSETHDYKAVYDFDMLIGENVREIINRDKLEGKTAFIIQAGDRGTVNMRYHEHDSGVISSDWALWGLLQYINPDASNNRSVIPIEVEADGIYHAAWNKDKNLLSNFEKIYYWRNDIKEFIEVKLNALNDTVFELVSEDGGVQATVKEHYDTGYILFN